MRRIIFFIMFCFGSQYSMADIQSDSDRPDANISASYYLDLALIDQERIAYWLKKRNKLSNDASKQKMTEAVQDYVENYKNDKIRPLSKESIKALNDYKQQRSKIPFNDELNKKITSAEVPTSHHVNVLAILIDFPDLLNNDNRLAPGDTPMYYSRYPPQHYSRILFSPNGFTGPNGKNYLSVYQYFLNESGNTFFFSGEVSGWYTASENASYYGKNEEYIDSQVGQLVMEAVDAMAASNSVNLADYDNEDPYDLDGDGNRNESDGIIDHVMIFHSSIGEETGGGVLGDDAIWSHRFAVFHRIENTPYVVLNYTIAPIDAATGVIAHEFGHDLGLKDEYDTFQNQIDAPVGYWSIMAKGSYLGEVKGVEPSGFSPLARDYLQQRYGGKWINQLYLDASELNESGSDITLFEAQQHGNSLNQVKIKLPPQMQVHKKAYSGSFNYASGVGNLLRNSLTFNATLPEDASLTLSMQAIWDIETDSDYVQFLVNDTPLKNHYTQDTSSAPELSGVKHMLMGKSLPNWTLLEFDLSDYAGMTVEVKIKYVTDDSKSGFGFLVDDLMINSSNGNVFFDNAETNISVLNGFEKTASYSSMRDQYYYVQLRSNQQVEKGLALKGYDPGVVMWFADENYTGNHVTVNPGHGFISVVDADQKLIPQAGSVTQIRDAAFSLFQQSNYRNDDNLSSNQFFDDSLDYSSPLQPSSGVQLPKWGIKFQVLGQAIDSSEVRLRIFRDVYPLTSAYRFERGGYTASFTNNSFGHSAINNYHWDFGDGVGQSSDKSPSYSYTKPGRYLVTHRVTDVLGHSDVSVQELIISDSREVPLTVEIGVNVSGVDVDFIALVDGGTVPFSYEWHFGDSSNVSNEKNPQHHYEINNIYEVQLCVTDAKNKIIETSMKVNVGFQLVADFSYDVSARNVTFTNLSPEPGDYLWDFGDGQFSTENSPIHNFKDVGRYSVTLTIQNSDGVTATKTRNVKVGGSFGSGSIDLTALFLLVMVLVINTYYRWRQKARK